MSNKIYVTKSSLPPFEEYMTEIQDIWQSHWLTNMGVKHLKLQSRLKMYLGVDNIELLTNGHMALELTLQALKLKGEVITTPFTFASTTHAIVRNGLTPVFCDINEDDYTLDVNKLEALITDKTCAILPVHVYGNVCNVEAIEEIAKKYNLKVIYDAAHAFGVEYKDKGIGTFGDASCFSFHATKVFNTIEGGAVSFGKEHTDFGLELYRLKNFGIRNEEVVDSVGANAKMNEFCAAMGLCNLRHIEEEIAKRKKIVERYRSRLSDIPGIVLCKDQNDVKSNYSYFPIRIQKGLFGADRDIVKEKMAEQGIFARKYFYPLTSAFDAYKGKFDVEKTPVALKASREILTLPLFADMDLKDVERICEYILKARG